MRSLKFKIIAFSCFLLVPILISCEAEIKRDGKMIQVDVDSAQKGKISDHFESIDYILLDYPDSLPIVGPYKMILTDDRIFVESRETAAVFVFDRKGNLQNVIRNYGDGPGQFRLIDDMFLENDLVRIHCNYLKKYLIFNLEGKFLEEGKLEEMADRSFIGKEFILYQFQEGYGPEKNTIVSIKDNVIQGFVPINKDLEYFNRYNNLHGFQYDPHRDSFFITSLLNYEIPVFDGKGFLKQKLDFDFGKNNYDINKRKEFPENPRKVNTYSMENNIVQHINSFFPFKKKVFVHFYSGIKNSHFMFLDNNFEIIYHVDELENDIDGMKLYMRSWAYSENEVVYYLESGNFYNDYVETFNDKKVKVKNGDVHDFFSNNKEKLKEEKHVLVVLKVKE